ncbi:MAG: signal peptidase II [Epsilonproteobacteria bacterium]|nr:signal peptidase II [Campylobacterota bacterium]
MKKLLQLCAYGLLAAAVFIADRASKTYALQNFVESVQLNRFISVELVFNRGISWGMLRFDDHRLFLLVSVLVITVCLLLALYACKRWYESKLIIGETMVFAGALSNVLDRFWYGGVVDFIIISYESWVFPIFNIADVCIVGGVFLMCLFAADDA